MSTDDTQFRLILFLTTLIFQPIYSQSAVDTYSLKSSAKQQQQAADQLSFSTVCQSGIREDNTNYIYCARRNLYQVPLFSKNNVVYDELVLSDNRIGELTKASFNRIKVKKIYLNGNPIRFIEESAFVRLENHLEELWMDADASHGTLAPGIPRAIVNYLRNLNRLKLKGFAVEKLENGVFKRLNRIEILSLQFCGIQEIEKHAFDGLANSLKELYLDGNQLVAIPTESLLQFRTLRVLSLAQNGIKSIEQFSFGYNPGLFLIETTPSVYLNGLTRLDMSYNGLKSVDSRAFDNFNSTLETLSLQNNEINSYNLKFLTQLRNLRELNLDFNLITRLGQNLFSNSQSLQLLSLQGNSIQFDDVAAVESASPDIETFAGLSSLIRLNLARNSIKSLPDGIFKPMRSLKSLQLDKNAIETLGEFTFEGVYTSLANLSLQYTKLTSASLVCLKRFETLERVKLGYNELSQIDFGMLNKRLFDTLTTLDAQHNRIEEIVGDVQVFESLLELDFSNNKLCSFGSEFLQKMPKLKNLALAQNPLQCDCDLLPLYKWTLQKYDKDVVNYIQWQCEIENDMPRMFTSLTEVEFKCGPGTGISKCKKASRKLESTLASTIASIVTIQADSAELKPIRLAKIASLQVRAEANSVYVNWELDQPDEDQSLNGFKLTYAMFNSSRSNSGSASGNKDLAFVVDKSLRQFKIDNLASDMRYTICVSLIRSQGYDKYCRDTDLIEAPVDKKQKIKLVNNQSAQLITNPDTVVNVAPETSTFNLDTHVLSGLMITILIILIVCIMALIVFIVIYIRRCRLTEKNLKKCITTTGAAYSTSTIGNSLSSRKANYTGALLTHTGVSHTTQKLIEIDVNNKCFCAVNPSSGTNPRFLNCLVHSNTIYNQQHQQHAIPCNCVNLVAQAGDSSTVSSTVSSSEQNGTDVMSLASPGNSHLVNEETSWRFMLNKQPILIGGQNHQQPDLALSTPTSFTHFILPSNHVKLNDGSTLMPYEVYNCFQTQATNNNNNINNNNNNHSTLIFNSGMKNQFGPNRFMGLGNHQHQMALNNNCNNNNNNANNNNDHVYCEIPSTISRSYRSSNQNEPININNIAINKNSQFNGNNNVNIGPQISNGNNNNRQNSSTSLLLSSSSSGSSNSTSPQSNFTNNTKFTNASMI